MVRYDWVLLNPQPLPPVRLAAFRYGGLGDAVALNPQPLPPRVLLSGIIIVGG